MIYLMKILLALVLVAALSACGGGRSTGSGSTDDEGAEIESLTAVDDESVEQQGLDSSEVIIEEQSLGQDQDLLSRTTLYFEYDSSDLDDGTKAVIGAHARYMTANPGVRITLEGHADERGTREYNLALGEGRALAAAVYFQALEVAGDRMDSITYGEERPVSPEQTDEGWRLNRRVEILYSY